MILLTQDEARRKIAASGARLLEGLPTDADPSVVAAALRGAGAVAGLNARSQRLARRHRHVLDAVVAVGYDWIAVEELDGLASAVGLDEDRFDPAGASILAIRQSAPR